MAKKASKAPQFSNEPSGTGTAAAPKKAGPTRTQKHLKAQASGVVAAVEGFVNSIANNTSEAKQVETKQVEVKQAVEIPVTASAEPKAVPHEEIAALAYVYYLNRGPEGGSQADDWIRAEQTLKSF